MFRTRVKICGMTNANQVANAVELGVDAIGMILHANSPRTISLEDAQKISQVVPAFVSLVGVFVNADKGFIEKAIEVLSLDLVQLHGDESNDFGRQLSRPFIKAIRAKTPAQVEQDMAQFPDAQAILFDPYVKGVHGGTGTTLDQHLWPKKRDLPLILAGGLSPINVAERISQLNPFAVDMNSGLESAPGVKDNNLMRSAILAVNNADLSS